ncbi:MAG: hypothetical protein QOH47_2588 [Sphingomonadales bacterium]|jgi:hypothetical protein|nr:hypothetical protein [Sphingomonadales bacterium]
MGTIKNAWGWAWKNLSNLVLLAGWLVSWGVFPWLLSMSQQASPLQYGIAAFAGGFAYFSIFAIWARAKLWRADTRLRERLASDSSPFDPMARVFENKRLFLKDIAPLGRREIRERKFINCEIIGPGDMVLDVRSSDSVPFPKIKDNLYHDVNFIQIYMTGTNVAHNAVFFLDCDFEGCNLYTLNLLYFHRVREDLNWITPNPNQPTLLPEPSVLPQTFPPLEDKANDSSD